MDLLARVFTSGAGLSLEPERLNHTPISRRLTSALTWPWLARFIALDEAAGRWAEQSRWRIAIYEFVRFGIKQGRVCLFGALMLALLIATHWFYPADAWLARYDFLVIAALPNKSLCSGPAWRPGRR